MKTETEDKQNWDFFMTEIEGIPASIFVDLALNKILPVEGYNKVLTLLIEMNNPAENGLSTSEESEKLFEIEDKITNHITPEFDTIFAGRMTYDGSRILYYYLKNDKGIKDRIEELLEEYEDYGYSADIEKDKTWSKYTDYLYPQKFEMQTILNRHVLEYLKEHGDILVEPREVDHYIYFNNSEKRSEFKKAIIDLGYNVTKEGKNENYDNPFSLIITRIDTVTFEDITDITAELFDLAEEYDGNYDGWETKIITNNN